MSKFDIFFAVFAMLWIANVHGFAFNKMVVARSCNVVDRRSFSIQAAKRFYGISKPIYKENQATTAPTLLKVQETVFFPMKLVGMVIAVITIMQKIATKHITSLVESIIQVCYYSHYFPRYHF